MSSVEKCNECISEHGLSPERCDGCRPKRTPSPLPSVEGCKGICCSCIERHGGTTDKVPCKQKKE